MNFICDPSNPLNFMIFFKGKPKNYRPKIDTVDRPKLDPSLLCLTKVESITVNQNTGETIIMNQNKLYIHDSVTMKRRKGPIDIYDYFQDGLTNIDASYTLPVLNERNNYRLILRN